MACAALFLLVLTVGAVLLGAAFIALMAGGFCVGIGAGWARRGK
jgi:hypothetical protein